VKPPHFAVLTAVPLGIAVTWLILRGAGADSGGHGPSGPKGNPSDVVGSSATNDVVHPSGAPLGASESEPAQPPPPELPATDPRAEGYNAAALHDITGRNLQEIYADEPRSEPWASTREQSVVSYSLDDLKKLDPNVEVDADCRTSSCRIRVYSSNPFLVEEMGDYPFACMARYSTGDLGMTDPGPPQRTYADYYLLFGEQNLDDAAFTDNRDRTCPKIRASWQEHILKPFDANN